MKKLFTVLAVLLVASVVFAATFSGNVKAAYAFDFDVKTVNYNDPSFAKVDAMFKWDTGVVTVGGEGDTHIDFAASASFEGYYNVSGDHAKGFDPAYNYDEGLRISPETMTIRFFGIDGEGGFDGFKALLKLDIDTFAIVGKDWEIDFLGNVALDFAKSAVDSQRFNKNKIEDNTVAYSINNSVKGNHNLAVTAFGGYKFGFGLGTYTEYADGGKKTDAWDSALNFALTAVTPDYDFNGVNAKFGAGYQVYDQVWKLALSAKASYATDKWSVGGAYDALVSRPTDAAYISNDLAVKFGFAPVTVDVYYANEKAQAKDKYYDYFDYDDVDESDHLKKKDLNYLSAKVVVDVAKVAENVPVTVTLTGTNLLNEDKQIVSLSASTTIVPNFKFGVYFNDWFDNETKTGATNSNRQKLGATVEFTGVERLTLNAEVAYKFAKGSDEAKRLYLNAGAAYAHDLFTATAAVAMEKQYEKDAIFGAEIGAKSTTLVSGAELSTKATFNLNKLAKFDGDDETNNLTFACKVSF